MTEVVPVILSGGSGTRLWPRSRRDYPKQLLRFADMPNTMIQETVKRVSTLGAPIVVCNDSQRFIVAEQLSEIGVTPKAILLEPVAKNTAPAIAVAALEAQSGGSDPVLVVLPADHLIKDLGAFQSALDKAITRSKEGCLVVFGVVPDKPETGYGYIHATSINSCGGARVTEFVEKPNIDTARDYLKSGQYYWNSGMFVFKASAYLNELQKYQPETFQFAKQAHETAKKDLDFIRIDKEAFSKCAEVSIDYAVMELTQNAFLIPFTAQWSDLGSWSSIWDVMDKDERGNVKLGDVLEEDCDDCLFYGEGHLIGALGVKDLIVVDTKDALLISSKDRVQDVKKLVDKLEHGGRGEHMQHREAYRPWGSYDTIERGERFQVKRITVKPGGKLSLQMHHHRAEHWIVVTGTALVENEGETIILSENQSTYIPVGSKHRLTNPGKVALELIEVQSGSYLGEDDIVRFEDSYGRN